ncbi:MAG: Holliday junction branch migration protein RuvA [Methanospirillum sp.]
MFAYLEGKVDAVDERSAVIDVGGVGYRVFVTYPTVQALRGVGGPVRVHTHLAVREDAWTLYGFLDPRDLEVFRVLLGVNKIGPALALKILGEIPVEELVRAVQAENEAVLTRVPGIGAKSARRLVLELRDRLSGIGVGAGGVQTPIAGSDAAADAAAALVALGFTPREAADAVEAAVSESPGADLQGLIRGALARLRRG